MHVDTSQRIPSSAPDPHTPNHVSSGTKDNQQRRHPPLRLNLTPTSAGSNTTHPQTSAQKLFITRTQVGWRRSPDVLRVNVTDTLLPHCFYYERPFASRPEVQPAAGRILSSSSPLPPATSHPGAFPSPRASTHRLNFTLTVDCRLHTPAAATVHRDTAGV